MPRSLFLGGFGGDRRGVAMVEFALLAPLLILFYVGMSEVCQGVLADRRTSHATSAVGDLVAQASVVTPDEVESIFDIAGVILAPYPTDSRLKLRVSSVKVDANGVAKVVWSDNKAWSDRTVGSTVDLPQVSGGAGGDEAFLRPGESAIMSEAEYSFVTPFSDLFVWIKNFVGRTSSAGASGFEYESTYFLRPRQSEEVTYKAS